LFVGFTTKTSAQCTPANALVTTSGATTPVYGTTFSSSFSLIDSTVVIEPTVSIDVIKVVINTGFVVGDSLSYDGVLPTGVTKDFNSTTGILTLSGAVMSAAEIQDIFRGVMMSSTSTTTANREILFVLGDAIPFNGNYYKYVASSAITWTDANSSANSSTHFGFTGYLATLTSAGEQNFVSGKLQGKGWLGGSDQVSEGVWNWVSGPESGTQFWQGNGSGSAVGGEYNNWNAGEPNDLNGEDYLHYLENGKWNDFANSVVSITGYLVEYGGMPGDPSCGPSSSKTLSLSFLADSDGDGIDDAVEGNGDTDGDGTPDFLDTDSDGDGTPDVSDAFPLDASEDTDTDGDGTGDNADTDDDNDGTPDVSDAFPLDASEDTDTDGDGTGDNADTDDDGDGIADSVEGNLDTDGDGIPNSLDSDGDGMSDANEGVLDTDGDGVLDYLDDVCLYTNPIQDISSCDSYDWNGVTITDSGVYIDTLLDASMCDSVISINLTIHDLPSVPTVVQLYSTTLTTGNYYAYQWYRDGVLMTGETNQNLLIVTSGIYTVEVFNEFECSVMSSNSIQYGPATNVEERIVEDITVYPNPSTNFVYIETPSEYGENYKVELYDNLGKLVKVSNNTTQFDLSSLNPSVYNLVIRFESGRVWNSVLIRQ
jgi:hypothetical protein